MEVLRLSIQADDIVNITLPVEGTGLHPARAKLIFLKYIKDFYLSN